MADINDGKNRPCCKRLRELASQPSTLKNPQEVEKLLETLSKHCVVMQLKGKKRTAIDFARSTCYMDTNPETTQVVIDEAGKTVAVNPELAQLYDLLAKANHALANNAKLQQISDRMQLYLAQMREGEKKFGRVPHTDILKENKQEMGLEAGDALKAHPLLADKTQFDGINPKSNPNPKQHPDAEKNARDLANRLELRPAPKPTSAPRFTPRGGG